MADVRQTALTEKALAAEQRVGLLRMAVILVGTVTYPFLIDQAGTIPWLAYLILGVAWLYAAVVVLGKPYRKFPVLASSLYTTASDSLLLMLWIYATGGYHSPYWAIMFLSILAIAYRFSLRPALIACAIYEVLYVGLVTAMGQWPGHVGVVFVRLSYLAIGTVLSGFISTQALQQMRERIETSRLAERERQLRAEATQSLSLLSATLESTADGLLVVDTEGHIRSFNRRFVELWRLPQSVVDSKSDDKALAFVVQQLQDPENFLRKVRELYTQPLAESHDTLEFKDGRVFERYSRPQLIDGQPAGRVWSFRDITERVRAEREREANREHREELERLKAVDAFKSQFINTAAHELNTPLTPILLQVHLLRKSLAGSGQSEGFEVLARNVHRLGELVSDLLDAAKYQSGRLVLDAKPTDVSNLVDECVASFREQAQVKGLELRTDVARPLMATLDRRRIGQVVYNLLSNAIKFTPKEGTVTVGGRIAEGRLQFFVADTGAGIAPADAAKLFLPFSQVHTGHGGTGLGLYISKGIVEAHGGTIRVASPGLGHGSTFTITLPLEPIAPAPHDATSSGGPRQDENVGAPRARTASTESGARKREPAVNRGG